MYYYLDKSLLTKGVFLFGSLLIFIITKIHNDTTVKSLLKIGIFTDYYYFLEEKLLPFPLCLKVLSETQGFFYQFNITLDYIKYTKLFLVIFILTNLILLNLNVKWSLKQSIYIVISNLLVLTLFRVTINVACNGIYQYIDFLEEFITLLGVVSGYLFHQRYLKYSKIQKKINKKGTKKITYDF